MYEECERWLINNGWFECGNMMFCNHSKPGYEIFFASSSSIEIYYNKKRIKDYYASNQEEFKQFIMHFFRK